MLSIHIYNSVQLTPNNNVQIRKANEKIFTLQNKKQTQTQKVVT